MNKEAKKKMYACILLSIEQYIRRELKMWIE